MENLINVLKAEVEKLSQESMQIRTQMEAALQQYNMKLGEYNGQMKAREDLIKRLEAGEFTEDQEPS